MVRSYKDLLQLETFEERFRYLRLNGRVGLDTFGFDRYLNQRFYKSVKWLSVRRDVILRDQGLDLGVSGHPILDGFVVHHINPVDLEDLESLDIFDPQFLITTSKETHRQLHYGQENPPKSSLIPRKPGDTKLW